MNPSIWNKWFVFGLIFTVVGITILLQQYIFHKQCTVQTQGLIGTSYQFGLPYKTLTFMANGEEYTTPFSYSKDFPEGETVSVFYKPSNKKHFYIADDTSSILRVGIICCIGGIIFMLCGYGLHIGLFTERRVNRFRIK